MRPAAVLVAPSQPTGLAKTAEVAQSMFIGPNLLNPLLKMLGADKIKYPERRCAAQLVGLGGTCATGCVLSRRTPCRWRCWS